MDFDELEQKEENQNKISNYIQDEEQAQVKVNETPCTIFNHDIPGFEKIENPEGHAEGQTEKQNDNNLNAVVLLANTCKSLIRKRTPLTVEQQQQLNQYFTINSHPRGKEIYEIASGLQLEGKVVQHWFRGKRAREQKLQHKNIKIACPLQIPVPPIQSIPQNSDTTIDTNKKSSSSADDLPWDLSVKPQKSNAYQQQLYPLNGIAPKQNSFGCLTGDKQEAVNLSRKMTAPYSAFKRHAAEAFDFAVPFPTKRGPNLPHKFRQTPSPLLVSQQTPPYAHQHSLMNSNKQSDLPIDFRGCSLRPCLKNKNNKNWSGINKRILIENLVPAHLRKSKPNSAKTEMHGLVVYSCSPFLSHQNSLAKLTYEHGKRPYQCIYCPEAFKDYDYLTEHKRLHRGENPLQ